MHVAVQIELPKYRGSSVASGTFAAMTTARFDGKVALITGAGSGIGRATALRLVSEGARVFGIDANEAGINETVDLAGAAMLGSVVDVTDEAACKTAVAACVAQLGGLDVLGNVAGIVFMAHFTEMTTAQYLRLMAVNVHGPVFMAQAAIPHLLERSGNIVNIASNAGLMGMAYNVAYSMSKGAVVQLTRSLAMEYIKQPLRVNANESHR